MRLGLIHRPAQPSERLGAALAAAPSPPGACNWHALIALDGDALGNDVHANCVECAALRAVQIMRAAVAGDVRKPTAAEALALYRAWAGWDGSEATDVGTQSDVAEAQWSSKGIEWGVQWEDVPNLFPLDPQNAEHLRAAVAFLGPIQLDLALPVEWERAVVWDNAGAPGSWGAHRVCAGRYDARFLYVVTWGEERAIPWGALPTYALGATATVSRSWLDTNGRSPGGLDLAALGLVAQEAAI
jgi:hypothetical protein